MICPNIYIWQRNHSLFTLLSPSSLAQSLAKGIWNGDRSISKKQGKESLHSPCRFLRGPWPIDSDDPCVVNLDYSLDLPRSNHLKLLDLHFERRKRRALDNSSSAKQKLQDSICKTCQLRFILPLLSHCPRLNLKVASRAVPSIFLLSLGRYSTATVI